MKNIIVLLLLGIFLVSCGKEDPISINEDCRNVEYDISFDLSLGDKVCFPNGNSLIITNIEHYLCPCQIECESELGLLISLRTITESSAIDKQFYTALVDDNRSIFNSYEIAEYSHKYDMNDSGVPCNKEDFDPEKTVLAFTISKI